MRNGDSKARDWMPYVEYDGTREKLLVRVPGEQLRDVLSVAALLEAVESCLSRQPPRFIVLDVAGQVALPWLLIDQLQRIRRSGVTVYCVINGKTCAHDANQKPALRPIR